MPDLYLGIDTSNYKTSIAVIDSAGSIVYERSEFLEVAQGSRGLRQSEAFFMHSNRLPVFIDDMCNYVDTECIRTIGVSSRPRRIEGSYMPCFLAGVNSASMLASVLGIPLHQFSHQEGHAAAVMEGSDPEQDNTSALFHLSGGTTEFLICTPDESGYKTEIVGGTKDISLGQLVDRAGVAMGYRFPAGASLDVLAEEYYAKNMQDSSRPRTELRLPPVRITDGYFNLSGIETKVIRHIESVSEEDYPETAYAVFMGMASLLSDAADYVADRYGVGNIYMAGGVSSSSFIRREIMRNKPSGDDAYNIVFSEPALSGDNAVGIARLSRRLSKQHAAW